MGIVPEQINQMIGPFFPGYVGLVFTHVEAGRSVCALDVTERSHNPGGVLHGGVPFTLADTGMSIALLAGLEEGQNCTTIEIKITYMKPVRSGKVTCDTRLLRKGKRVAFLESDINDDTGLVAKASGSFFILSPVA